MPEEPRLSLLARLLASVVRGVVARPMTTLAIAGLLAATGIGLAASRLEFRTSRLDLVAPDAEFHRQWLAYLEEFGDGDDAVLVIEGARDAIAAATDDLTRELQRAFPEDAVLGRLDFSAVESRGLHLLDATEGREVLERLRRLPRGAAAWRELRAARLVHELNRELADSEQASLTALKALQSALRSPSTYASPWTDSLFSAALRRQLPDRAVAEGGRLGLVMVRIERRDGVPNGEQLRAVRAAAKSAARSHPATRIGLTGVPVLEHDEMQASQQDMGKASLASLGGVAILFAAGFGGLRLPLLAVATLLISLCWCLGFIVLAVGHLNILSVAFGAILIGLGIDFGIHLVARYVACRGDCPTSGAALESAAARVGPGIVTGGLTTALAFLTAVLTDFRGVAELGLIAAGGVVLCVVASLTVLPALIQRVDRNRVADATRPLPAGVVGRLASAAPWTVLLAALSVTAWLGWEGRRVHYDHNLLNLQPTGLESVDWELRLSQGSSRSVWFALSVADDPRQLRERRRRFESLDSVERTESLADLLAAPDLEREAVRERIANWCAGLPDAPPVPIAPRISDLAELDAALARTQQAAAGRSSEAAALSQQVRNSLAALPAPDALRQLESFQAAAAADLWSQLRQLAAAARSDPPTLADLPPPLVSRFVGRSGRHALRVFAKGEIWNRADLEQFVGEVQSVDPACTGHPIEAYYASQQMQRSFLHAAIYSLLAVAAVLMLDFRSIGLSLLAMTPMALGMAQLFGLLALAGIPLNPANLIVLPLILGIGIDDGVHVVHDFRRRAAGAYRLGDATATAVLVTSATTMVGFGSLMLARHQGLQSLGQVLTLGVFCCLATSLIVLPAILAALTRGAASPQAAPAANAQAPAANAQAPAAKAQAPAANAQAPAAGAVEPG